MLHDYFYAIFLKLIPIDRLSEPLGADRGQDVQPDNTLVNCPWTLSFTELPQLGLRYLGNQAHTPWPLGKMVAGGSPYTEHAEGSQDNWIRGKKPPYPFPVPDWGWDLGKAGTWVIAVKNGSRGGMDQRGLSV